MADDLKDEIKLSLDASGVETGVNSAKRSIDSLGTTVAAVGKRGGDGLADLGKRGGESFSQMGKGGEEASRKVEQATRNMVNSLQRQIAAAEAGSTSTRQYYESIARLRGANADVLKPYLDQLDEAKRKTESATESNKKLGGSFSGLGTAASLAARAVAAVGIAVSAGEFLRLADASTNVASRLRLVTSSTTELTAVQQRLFEVAQSTRVSYADLVGTYAQVARSTKELGISQSALLGVIETISQAVTISGGSAESTQAALVQLSQGFAAGALRGEELNSVMEQTPRLAQAIAEGLGVSIGKLREMGQAGELTAEKVIGALEKAAVRVRDEFSQMTLTVEQSSTKAANSAMKLVGAIDSLTGVSTAAAAAMSGLSSVMDFIARDLEKLGSQGPLRDATNEVHALERRAALLKNGLATGFYPPGFQRELDMVNAKLLVAKQRFQEVYQQFGGSGKDPRDQTGFPSRSDGIAAEASRQKKLKEDANKFLLKLDGVPDSYLKEMNELIRLNKEGVITGKAYTDALKKQQDVLLKKVSGKGSMASGVAALNDSLNAELQAYKNTDKLILDGRKSFYDQLSLMQRLGVTGEFEALDQSVAKEEEVWNKRKANFEAEIAQASKKKNSATEVARITGQMQDAEREYLQNATKLQGDLAQLEQRQINDLENRIDKQREAARMAGEQVETAKLEGQAIGLVGDALREQNAAILENKLKKLEALAVAADVRDSSGDLGKAYRLEAAELRKLNEEQSNNRAKQLVTDYAKSVGESNRLIQAEVNLLGLSSTQREIALEHLRIQIELEKRILEIESLQLDEATRKERIAQLNTTAATDMANAANKVVLTEWKKTTEQINQSLTDALLRGFEDGKGFAENFRDTLKNLFRTLVLRPVISFIVNPIGNIVGGVVNSVLGGAFGGGGGGGIMGMASNTQSAYSLFSGNNPYVNAVSGWLGIGSQATSSVAIGSTLAPAASYAAPTGVAIGTTTSAAPVAGIGAAGWAAGILAIPALGWYFADKFDKGDSFSGAAYATSGGDDPYTQVTPGALNPNMDTGDRPDREAIKKRLREMGAPESSMEGLNDRALHRMMILGETTERQSGGDPSSGGLMNWNEWSKSNKDLPDFYQGQGYASPEQMGWFEQQDMGGRDDHRQWDSFFQDPTVTAASRQMAESILAPIKSISDMLGNDDAYKVATGLAWNNKTGKITGGLQVWENDESVLNWGSKEFDNKDEYLRSTLSDSLGVLETMDGVPEWLKKQVDGAQEQMSKLEGENIGQRAGEIFVNTANSVTATFKQIETLIGIIPDLAGLSQDAVYSIGQAFGSLENYTGAYSGYVQNYYSDEERAGYVRGGINSSLAEYGLSVDEDTTKEDYRAMIEAQDLTTESGRKAYAALIMASEAFAGIAPAAEDAANALARMEDLLKTQKELQAEWAAITGDVAGAEQMRREMAIEGMSEEETAQYDANVALQKRIDAEKVLIDLLASQTALEIEWATITGDLARAEQLRRDQAIKGMNDEQIAQYDSNEALQARIDKEKEFQSTISGIGSSLTGVLKEGLLGNLTGADLGGQMADAVIGGVYNALANSAAQQITDMMMSTIIDPLVRAALVGSLTAETVSKAVIENMVARAKAVAEALGMLFNDPEFKALMAGLGTMFKDIAGTTAAQPYYSSYANQQKNAQKEIAQAAERAAEQVKSAWEGVGDSLMDQVKRIRGDMADSGLESLSYWQSEFAIETAKARAGDVDAAGGLNALSSSLLEAAAKGSETSLELQQMRAWVAQSLQDTAGYANAFAGGALTAKPGKTPATVFNPVSLANQAPVVVAADPGLLAEVRELRRLLKEQGETLIKQGTEGNNMSRRRELFGTSVYQVPAPV